MYFIQNQDTDKFLSGKTKGHGFFDWSDNHDEAESWHTLDELLHFLVDSPVTKVLDGQYVRVVFSEPGRGTRVVM